MAAFSRRISKLLLGNRPVKGALVFIAYSYIRLVYATCRWEVTNPTLLVDLIAKGEKIICCCWHSRVMMMFPLWPIKKAKFHIVASQHRDGAFIGKIIEHFGIDILWGSSGRRGRLTAVREAKEALQRSEHIGISPDGPRGPRMRVSGTIVEIAASEGAVIVPVAYAVKGAYLFNSWDRFMLPFPFRKGRIIFSNPIQIPREADEECIARIKQELEQTLTQITHTVDDDMGIPRTEAE